MKPHSILMAAFVFHASIEMQAQEYLTNEAIREQMEEQRNLKSTGSVAINDLPKRISYDSGEISLVADPWSSFESSREVYLINDTDETVENVIGEGCQPIGQVQVGGLWVRDEPFNPGCGGAEPPKNLRPRHAVVLTGWCAAVGDFPCERRFTIQVGNRILTSNPFPSVSSRQAVEQAIQSEISADSVFMARAFFGSWWKRGGAETMEEFVAALELARCHGQFSELRAELLDRLRTTPADVPEDEKRAMEEISELLKKPWLFNNDKQSLVSRCLVALEGREGAGYGTPEKFPTLVWKFLVDQQLAERGYFYQNGVRFSARASLVKLVKLAQDYVWTSSDSNEVAAAASFLASRSLDESLVPMETYRDFLKSGKVELIREGLTGLSGRGHADEAGEWLASHADEMSDQVAKLYARIWLKGFREPKAWEMKVIERSLKVDPWTFFGQGSINLRTLPSERLPSDWKSTIRQFLHDQLAPEEIAAWKNRSEATQREPGVYRVTVDFRALDSALNLVGSWNDAADDDMFRAYLEFPAFVFTLGSPGAGWKEFRLRVTAEEILKSRMVETPEVVTKSLVVLEPPQPIYQKHASQWFRKWPSVAPFFAGILVAWIFTRLARRRSQRRVRSA